MQISVDVTTVVNRSGRWLSTGKPYSSPGFKVSGHEQLHPTKLAVVSKPRPLASRVVRSNTRRKGSDGDSMSFANTSVDRRMLQFACALRHSRASKDNKTGKWSELHAI